MALSDRAYERVAELIGISRAPSRRARDYEPKSCGRQDDGGISAPDLLSKLCGVQFVRDLYWERANRLNQNNLSEPEQNGEETQIADHLRHGTGADPFTRVAFSISPLVCIQVFRVISSFEVIFSRRIP
jgi:hypothetical protein